ncbi:hypothetical protein COW36_03145 [bacterium (Candidatus Blackallbacteria) CG17_big_fil_post_rev_8_21_14_2_50_48_46]|uniref:Response regulatory domain-containing protein n=1 Tax=bacterium (Candidatus Blackallbacteria) CG17_big_fil_post_rev_8_21_14_2_50_48_46 TaxID=2014261 RepID=A0A2M7G9P8_9BACT|nr:MAG: hypothetical protein COW64_08650 [bacterium (Candidatus Blackallbacteria) CG18_big_fil_WC_8_21_14_2_50_49_26]PIW18852.1 MAG: hypothetical protein COW36_03145 [bacterium (Candidatus Blackallbacteria) CG17_big_fil_post_rev_8_21_14_2_50_48_46]PIW44843.1 MAG: hypothetical protein COW20_22540 [bacterium (Candidatus Blackallbacteria) CG13_big_fil_rev_8_21_14_2_50_49_14]
MDLNKELTILLIDDELHFCQLAKDILAMSACNLIYFTDSRAGLREALSRKNLDLILLDIEMPDPDGLEILRQLKKSHNRRVPVMMFTAHAEMSVVQQALQLGANEYILKPFSVHNFVARISHILDTNIFQNLPSHLTPQALDNGTPPETSHRILMVDDDPQALKLAQDMFEVSSCTLETFSNPKEALMLVQAAPPDLILLDMHMPEMDGVSFLKALRAQNLKTPVIVISAENDEETIKASTLLGIEAYLLKPYRFHDLVSKVEKVLKTTLFAGRL